jgi:outer membrane murein-binding lipoprotein Lpp
MSSWWWPWEIDQLAKEVATLKATVNTLEGKIMATQADIDALTTQVNSVASGLTQVGSDLDAAQTKLQAEIDALAQANPSLNLSALQAAVAPIGDAVTQLDQHAQSLGNLVPDAPTP